MRKRLKGGALAALVAAAMAVTATAVSAHSGQAGHRHGAEGGQGWSGQGSGEHGYKGSIKHVLLISVDGLHQSDLQWYVANHPSSELAKLIGGGAEYEHALTPVPSDSFPGMVGQVTGGNPSSTGVYYDDEYSHDLLPPGSTPCTGQKPGTSVDYFEIIAKDPSAIDSGQGLPSLPDNILQLTGTPQSPPNLLINTATLPVDPATCSPVFPHQYLKVNTVFNVARDHGLRTAWSDKHVAYEILNGPSGTGIQDLFAPEINSDAQVPGTSGAKQPAGGDYTSDNAWTMQYDSYKVQAILNEIDGYDHSRTNQVGTPAIFGMNFQTVSTAQKLPVSDGLNGGYLPGTDTPGPLLQRALDYINAEVGAMDAELQKDGLSDSTAIIISAKHGQSPIDPSALTRIDDGAIIDAINAAYHTQFHTTEDVVATDVIAGGAAGSRDDAFPLWLNNRSREAANFVKDYLWDNPATGTTYNPSNPATAGPNRTLQHSGLKAIFAGESAADYFDVPRWEGRHPDVWGVVQHGVVYTGGVKKIAEHGGAGFEDRNVPILVYAPGAVRAGTSDRRVETTQIAPTILRLLGLDPSELQAVQEEGTPVLPAVQRH